MRKKARNPAAVPSTSADPPAELITELAAAVADVYRAGDRQTLTAALERLLRGIEQLPGDGPNRGLYLAVAGQGFARRFARSGRPDDLRAALEHGEQAAAAIPADDPQRHSVLANLGSDYLTSFQHNDDLEALDAGIEWLEESLELTPADEPARTQRLSNLGLAYQWRFRHSREADDQESMIELYEQALDAPHEDALDQPAILAALRVGYLDRYGRGGDRDDLDTAIAYGEQAIAACDGTEPSRATWLFLLAYSYQERFDRTGDLADLAAMLRHIGDAVAAGPDQHPGTWSSVLGTAAEGHRRRFDRTAALADLEASIDHLERAVAATDPGDRQRARWSSNLSVDRLSRYRLTGNPADLEAAVGIAEKVLAGAAPDDPDRGSFLINVAMTYSARYGVTSDIADLNACIELDEQAVRIASGYGRGTALNNLATDHLRRYEATGSRHDLDAGIEIGERALGVPGRSAQDRSALLSNVAAGYRNRYARFRDPADLDLAIQFGEQAVETLPAGHSQRPQRLRNLVASYLERSKHAGTAADRAAAVERAEEALAAVPADDPAWINCLTVLGGAYLNRYRQEDEPADLHRTIELAEQALAAVRSAGLDDLNLLSNLAIAYRELVGRGESPPPRTIRRLVDAVDARVGAEPVLRASAAHNIGLFALETGALTEAATMLRTAVETLPECAPQALDWSDQEFQLAGSRGLVGEAVAAQLAVGDVTGAVEVAELGRGVLLANRMSARADLTALARTAPALAAEFDRLRTELATPAPDDFGARGAAARSAWHTHRLRAAERWANLLGHIRELPGFADFLAPPRFADLQGAAADGAVVLVNASSVGGDAVLLRGQDVTRLPLPELRLAEARERVGALAGLVLDGDSATVTVPGGASPELLAWLWETTVAPVLAALGHDEPAGETPPRVWWVPTGVLSLLPLHAAGLPAGPSALDRVVSSYLPTIRALTRARQRPPATRRDQLIVSMRHTAGLPDLPGCAAEAAQLRARHPGALSLADADATVAAVLAGLSRTTWAHFSCHGSSHPVEAAKAGLHLHDALLSVPEVSRHGAPTGELAYLSACSTGQAGLFQADEVAHLGAAFQLTAYRHVIATLWPVHDTVAADAAKRFYELLGDSAGADRAGRVLHEVTRELRERYPGRPGLWAPFVHIGP